MTAGEQRPDTQHLTPDTLPLDTRAIESELARIWREAADGVAGGLVRATSLTLLVLLTDESLAPQVDEVLAQVAPAHPCRVIVVELRDVEPGARLAAHCRPPQAGQPPACWEDVRLEGRAADLNRLISAARVLVLPNLPVQVWWPGDADLGGELFPRAVELGDRIIVDSTQFADPLLSLAQYAADAQHEHGTVGFVDLGWRRLEPWRLLVAQLFDAPSDRAFLDYIESVTVGFEPHGGFAEAFLLIGWLASRLGWTLAATRWRATQGLHELRFDNGGAEVRVEFRPRGAVVDGGTGGLASLELRANDAGRLARYAVQRSGEVVTTTSEVGGQRREAQVHLTLADEAELLREELGRFGRDRIYEQALQAVQAVGARAAAEVPSR